MIIFGAGLSGLIAGVLNQNAEILEPFGDNTSHQALLRFRSPQIGEAVGIPFKEIEVYKGIWDNGDKPISPHYIALYSSKVSNTIAYRSIRRIDSELRWIAPMDFQDQLKEICKNRITYKVDIMTYEWDDSQPVVSTLPMRILAEAIGRDSDIFKAFDDLDISNPTKPIYVNRYRIPRCDVYMTYYYPSYNMDLYRASITGDMLIVESLSRLKKAEYFEVIKSFGLEGMGNEQEVCNYKQIHGKISPINEKARREFILKTTMDLNIYSLGRFAVWRNLLLDDVYHDILKIKEFINKDKYEHYRDQ